MPTRAELYALVTALRHAHTRLLPMGIAERVQHAIVRIEEQLASNFFDAVGSEAVAREAQALLDECARHLPKTQPQ
jgi:hypothetical protein